MKIGKIFLSSLAAVGIWSAQLPVASANPILSYDTFDVKYQWEHVNGSDFSDSNGVGADIRISPIEDFFIEGGYSYASSKFAYTQNVNADLFTYGAGGYYEICPELHVVGRAGLLNAATSIEGLDPESHKRGWYGGGEVRYAATEDIEVSPYVNYYAATSNDNWDYGVQGFYAVHENIAIQGLVGLTDHGDVDLQTGLRFAW